jgi:hypothetical protein
MRESRAYLVQARGDMAVFDHLIAQDRAAIAECHPLHDLQMAGEKIAKAAFLAIGLRFDRYSHVAFSRLPYHLRRRDIAAALGWTRLDAFRSFLDRAAPLFRQIDELSPAVGPQRASGGAKQGPNTEYPWRPGIGAGDEGWSPPCLHVFGLLDRLQRTSDGRLARVFIERLIDRFDRVFPA